MKRLLRSSKRYRFKRSIRRISNLLAYYPFDEVEGSTARNYAPANIGVNNGTITGSSIGQTGRLGRSFSFNGSTDKVVLQTGKLLGGRLNSSIVMLVNTTLTPSGGDDSMYVERGTSGGDIWKVEHTSTLRTRFTYRDDAGTLTQSSNIAGGTKINDGNWHLLVVTKSATIVNIYIDGVLYSNFPFTLTATDNFTNATVDVEVAKDPTAPSVNSFAGKIAHIAAFSKALSSSEQFLIAHKAGFV